MTALGVLTFLLLLGWLANRLDYQPSFPPKQFPPPDISRRDLEG